jgi:putative mRNA 3-end processing factor
MISTGFLVYTPKGLYCTVGDFFLDPKRAVSTAVISHAHADHAVAGHDTVHCTSPTAAVMKERYMNRSGKKFFIHPSDHSFLINGVKIKFIPAGHILGSVQVMLEFENVKYLYTGDFKLQPDETCEPFQFTDTDVLITECTFAEKHFSHPDPESEIEKIISLGKPLVIGAYALGKAQRITQLISKHCPEKEIFVHHDIYPYHKIYTDHKINLGSWKPYSSQLFKRMKQSVYIVPPKVLSGFK